MISRHVSRVVKAMHIATCRQQPTASYFLYTVNKRWFAAEALDEKAILDRMKKVLGGMERAKLDPSKPLTPEIHIYNDIGLDSLDFVEFGIALEDEFEIEMLDDKAEKLVTVGDAVKLIQECAASPQAQEATA